MSFTRGVITTDSVNIQSSSREVGLTTATLTFSFTPGTSLRSVGIVDLHVPVYYSVGGESSTMNMFSTSGIDHCTSS